ncbi:MAG: c-type cytochrome domain-containing protein [Akkermansiaceae bacterium]
MKAFLFSLALVTPVAALDYKKDVMPIFKEKCYDCHSSEAKKVKGGLRLDDEEHFYKRFAKNDVVIPGDWDASYLFVTVVWPEHKKGAMPPRNKGERLTEKEVRTMARWIHEGAKIDGKKGKEGPDKWDPDKMLKFKDGRLVTEQFGPEPKILEPVWEEWKNAEGDTIVALFRGLTKGKVTLELQKTGKRVSYPLSQLSKECQKKARKLEAASSSMEMMEKE